jgi:hypothetical protein
MHCRYCCMQAFLQTEQGLNVSGLPATAVFVPLLKLRAAKNINMTAISITFRTIDGLTMIVSPDKDFEYFLYLTPSRKEG